MSHVLNYLSLENNWFVFFSMICFKYFIYLFLDRGEGWKKERESNITVWLPLTRPLLGTWSIAEAYTLTGNQTRDFLIWRLALSPLCHNNQGCSLVCDFFSNHATTICSYYFGSFRMLVYVSVFPQYFPFVCACGWLT